MDCEKHSSAFAELNEIVGGKDFIYIITFIACEDFIKQVDADDKYDPDKLHTNELLLILGIWCKNIKREFTITSKQQCQELVLKIRALLTQLHVSLATNENLDVTGRRIFNSNSMKETFFYGGEGAYDLQLIQFIEPKYRLDRDWIKEHKNLDINLFSAFYVDLFRIMTRQLRATIDKQIAGIRFNPLEFSTINISWLWKINPAYIQIIDEFSFDITRPIPFNIDDIGDYNLIQSKPIIKINPFQIFIPIPALVEKALYETPFYWIGEDKEYYNKVGKHTRGRSAEQITFEVLTRVLPQEQTYMNVEIQKNSKSTLAEIDVLSLYGDTAIIIQVKSKRLTVGARKGQDHDIETDFKQAIEKAYEQANQSEIELLDPCNKCLTQNKEIIDVSGIKRTLKIGITLDDLPANNLFVMCGIEHTQRFIALSIFQLDTIITLIPDPADLLKYLHYRCACRESFVSENEYGFLGFWLCSKFRNISYLENPDGKVRVIAGRGLSTIVDKEMRVRLLKKNAPELYEEE